MGRVRHRDSYGRIDVTSALRILEGAPAFRRAGAADLHALAASARVVTYRRKQRLRKVESERSSILVVGSGSLGLRCLAPDGFVASVERFGPGDVLGLGRLRPSNALDFWLEAEADPTVVCAVPRRALLDLLAPGNADLIDDVLDYGGSLRLALVERLISVMTEPLPVRLVRWLLRIGAVFHPVALPTDEEIGSWIGTTRVPAGRALGYLRALGVVADSPDKARTVTVQPQELPTEWTHRWKLDPNP